MCLPCALEETVSGQRKKKSGARGPNESALVGSVLNAFLEKHGDAASHSALGRAQEIVWDAWEIGDKKRRITLAKKALAISPMCADAYSLLAQDEARTPKEALALYEKGVKAGEKALGKRAFREDAGYFWGILETRPYMRARQGLATTLWELEKHDAAVAHFAELLRLNPGDNQGIRYLLLDGLLILGRDEQAAQLIKRYREDASAAWLWSTALAQFRRDGDSTKSRKALAKSQRANLHVRAYLLGSKPLPRELPDFITWGGEDEAIAYVGDLGGRAWAAAPGALDWLRAQAG